MKRLLYLSIVLTLLIIPSTCHCKTYYNDKIKQLLIEWVEEQSQSSRATAIEIVNSVCRETDEPLLYLSIFRYESNFNSRCISRGNFGLGQISLINYKELKEGGIISNKKQLLLVNHNVRASRFILKKKLKQSHNNIRRALYLYVGNSSRHSYVKKVLGNYTYLKHKIKSAA